MTSKVVCAEYATNEKIKILDRKIYDEGILNNIKNAINFIEKRIKFEFVIKSAKRIEIPQYPQEAYREVIVNAIMHRDYFDKSSDIMIESYRNKLVIYNPGGLVKWLKPEEFGKISKTRNPIIASLLSRTIYVEKMGTGIKRIKDAMKNRKLPKPKFEFYEHSFYVELFDKNYLYKQKDEVKDGVKVPVKVPEKVTVKVPEKVTVNQSKIIDNIAKNPHITIKVLAEIIGISERKIKENISKLKEKKLIKRIGPDKGGHWSV